MAADLLQCSSNDGPAHTPNCNRLKMFTIGVAILSLIQALPGSHASSNLLQPPYGSDYPTRDLAGVTVIDTPIVRDAEKFAQAHGTEGTFKHVMRSWVYGVVMINQNETLRDSVDLEVHAVASILHDLGWDRTPGSPLISPDKRFEVDAAIAAREWIRNHTDGQHWEERRVQLVWDAIALHAEAAFFNYKETDVMVVGSGVSIDLRGPRLGVTKEKFDEIAAAIPRFDLASNRNESLIWLCRNKPVATYGKLPTKIC
jgi:hypothetical protein